MTKYKQHGNAINSRFISLSKEQGAEERSLLPFRVKAPWSRTSGGEIEPEKAVENGTDSSVYNWPDILRKVKLEIRYRHLA
jgi:hypothetical protein